MSSTFTTFILIDRRCEIMRELSIVCCYFPPANKAPYHVVHIVITNAPKYSADSHDVSWLKILFATLAAFVAEFVAFSCLHGPGLCMT